MGSFTRIAAAFLLLLCAGCRVDLEKEKAALLKLHDQQRLAHFNKDIEMLLSGQTERFMNIQNGSLTRPSVEEQRKKFDSYFKRVEFVKWDDWVEPIVMISDDATLANTFVQKIVVVSLKDDLNQSRLDTSYFAWTTTYQKQRGEWQLAAITSTRK